MSLECGAKLSALDELALLSGIAESTLDVFDVEHKTSPDLKRALLGAMGFQVHDEAAEARALNDIQMKEWSRTLPPIFVADRSAGPVLVPIVVPQASLAVRWILNPEQGEELSGNISFKDVEPIERGEVDGIALARRVIDLGDSLPCGYHTLRVEAGESSAPSSGMSLVISPGKCWLPDPSLQQRYWGLAVNLPLVRSHRNWGIGDFTDLRTLVDLSVEHGAQAIGLNPLHAMFLDTPEAASPYSPSDRTLLNVLNVDIESVPGFEQCEKAHQLIATEQFQERLQRVRDASLVQYEAVAELKLAVLRLLFSAFEQGQDNQQIREFQHFHDERRVLLDRACLFQALRAHFAAQTPPLSDSKEWPEEFRTFESAAVREFADRNSSLIRFHLWMQWVADSQLQACAGAASQMPIGLYRDLAVGAHPSGAEVWSYPGSLVSTARVGAPPDLLNTSGQDWGLPPLDPIGARESGYQSFVDLLRSNMRHAGALRIDHAMALRRLYWIPRGNKATDGAYVEYATEDLVGILALESQRNRCLVVGEDLGTVPEGFRERMAAANVLSYRILSFEKEEDHFRSPEEYPYLGLSVISNHDLPTLRGWWLERDIDLRDRLGMYPEGAQKARDGRAEDRAILLRTLNKEELLDQNRQAGIDEYGEAANKFLARTRCLLTLIQLDDLTREDDQVNLPGTSDEHPNWRRRISVSLEQLAAGSELRHIATIMHEERGSAPNTVEMETASTVG